MSRETQEYSTGIWAWDVRQTLVLEKFKSAGRGLELFKRTEQYWSNRWAIVHRHYFATHFDWKRRNKISWKRTWIVQTSRAILKSQDTTGERELADIIATYIMRKKVYFWDCPTHWHYTTSQKIQMLQIGKNKKLTLDSADWRKKEKHMLLCHRRRTAGKEVRQALREK